MRLNAKIIALTVLGVFIVVGLIWGASLLILKNQQNSPQIDSSQDLPQIDNQDDQQSKDTKKQQEVAVEDTIGRLSSVDADANTVKVVLAAGEELTLKVPQEGASFYKQTKTEENTYTEEEVNLLDIPVGQEVEIQYDSNNNELLMVVVTE